MVELGLEVAQLLLQLSHAHHDDVLGLQRAHVQPRNIQQAIEQLLGIAQRGVHAFGQAPLLGRLAVDATASLVVQKHLGADSLQRWLIELGYRCERVGSKAGYRLFTVRSDR